MMIGVLLKLLLASQLVQSIDVGLPALKKFGLHDLEGVHLLSLIQDRPPSSSNFTVYIDFSEYPNHHQIDDEHCPKDSQICAINKLTIPGEGDFITEIISFPTNLEQKVDVIDKQGFTVSMKGRWGTHDTTFILDMTCSPEDEGLELLNVFTEYIRLIWKTPLACTSKSKYPSNGGGHHNNDNGVDDSSSWGWFTWLFIFLVIIFAGYVIGNAWINANSTGSNEFLNEVVDSLVEVLNRLPSFLKEIWNKIFGGDERGGYSAV